MSELLNLDGLLDEEKLVVFEGKNHPIKANTVETWLQLVDLRQKAMELSEDEGIAEGEVSDSTAKEMLELQIKIAAVAIPSIPEEKLRALPMGVLIQLVNVVGAEMSFGGDEPDPDGEESGEAEEGEVEAET